jgi:MoxR-like ATPase
MLFNDKYMVLVAKCLTKINKRCDCSIERMLKSDYICYPITKKASMDNTVNQDQPLPVATQTATSADDIKALNEKIQKESAFVELLSMEMDKVIVGQKHMVERLLIGLLSDGHILLEGVPGLAKTLAINTLASTIDAQFSRVQFTPDLLPADLLGTMIYSQKKEEFSVKKGPIFSNFVLADEINRAPAKVQSALLEAMQEKQVTIGENTFELPRPFLVLATQNPVEQEGTYPLPEAQVDRFMLKVVLDYPKKEEERLIIRNNIAKAGMPKAKTILKPEAILKAREVAKEVYMDEKIEKYIVDIVFATRYPEQYGLEKFKPLISFGGSPRASINLAKAAKAYAFIKRRGYVIPEDVRAVSLDILRHRIGLTYEAEAENITTENIISEILNSVEVP